MTLELVVDKLDSIPEALRTEYTEKDGKFHLNVNGIEDTAGLKSALQKERAAAAESKKALSAFTALGKTPEEIAAQVAAEQATASEALKKAGKFDELLGQHKANWEKESGARITALTAENESLASSERNLMVSNGLVAALAKAKATAGGIKLLSNSLGARVKVETVDGKRIPRILTADGKSDLVGKGADGFATFDELVAEALKEFPELFEATGAGGGGKPNVNGGGGTGAKTLTRKAFDELSLTERAAKMKDGFRIVD